LAAFGYPQGFPGQPIRKIAVCNGSECAIPQIAVPGSSIFSVRAAASTTFLSELTDGFAFRALFLTIGVLTKQPAFLLSILPGTSKLSVDLDLNTTANPSGNQVFHNKISFTKRLLFLIPITANITNKYGYSPTGVLPYDSYPGSYFGNPIGLNVAPIKNWFIKFSLNATEQPWYGFVQVPSALDIGLGNVTLTDADYTTKYSGSIPLTSPKTSPFDNYFTASSSGIVDGKTIYQPLTGTNEEHTNIYSKTGDFLANELNVTSPNNQPNCSVLCSNITINGPGTICTNGVYSLSVPLPTGSTVLWNVTGPVSTTSLTQNPITLTNTGPGTTTLGATVTACSHNTTIAPLTIGIGNPPLTGTYNYSAVLSNGSINVMATVNALPGSNSYDWYTVVNGNLSYTGTSGLYFTYNIPPLSGIHFQCVTTNTCGKAIYDFTAFNGNNPPRSAVVQGFTVFPVPASSQLMVQSTGTILPQNSTNSVASKDSTGGLSNNTLANTSPVLSTQFDVTIKNSAGVILSHGNAGNNTQVPLDTSKLPNGIYFLQILDKGKNIQTEIQIQH
jgi:hypothetical protein